MRSSRFWATLHHLRQSNLCSVGRCRLSVVAGSGPDGEIGVADLAKTVAPEARLVAAVHGGDGEVAEPAHRLEVGADVGAVELVEQWPVVHGVAGEQDARRLLPQADAPG